MKLAYVAGPYRGKSKNKIINKLQVIRNIRAARSVAKELWQMGYAVICPHSNTALFDGVAPDKTFLDGDIVMLKRCDLIVMMPHWLNSSGAIDELCIAQANGIPAYKWDGVDLVPLMPGLRIKRVNALAEQDLD
jgi:hypothetical protein